MRVSEFTYDKRMPHKCIKMQGVHFSGNAVSPICKVTIPFSKTDQRGHSQTILILPAPDRIHCPVSYMLQFLEVRPKRSGPLFIHVDGSGMTRQQFSVILKRGIKLAGLGEGSWGSHSLRIGAATWHFMHGASDDEIRKWGRWSQNSTVFQRYIRPPVPSSSTHGSNVNC